LTLNVQAGQCYGLFGRNGAGKTTTMKCLLNLLRPQRGQVRVFGLDPAMHEVEVKRSLSYVPVQVAFYPWMSVRETLDYLNDELQVDNMQIAPGYAYEKAPDQEHFLGVEQTRAIFREAFADGRRERWRLNHSPLYLDFLEGKVDFSCTAWGIPSYSVFGWQRPCYLMSDAPYAQSYKELARETDWSRYGRGRHPKCENCMAHCGYEPTAVLATTGSIKEMVRAAVAR
jgi:ABC-type sugar transport system ATPase subunit